MSEVFHFSLKVLFSNLSNATFICCRSTCNKVKTMSSKYRVGEDAIPHFVTFSVIGWIDVFSREIYKQEFVKSLEYCINKKELQLHAWVIMTNHVHLIISSRTNKLEDIVRDLKKFTSRQIIKCIEENRQESRKEWMLSIFRHAASTNINNTLHQFWKQDYHPIELNSVDKTNKRLNYLHENPVRSGLVWHPWEYKYGSGIDYYTDSKGLLPLVQL